MRYLILIYMLFTVFIASSQSNFSNVISVFNGNESADRIFGVSEGFQIFGGGIVYDTFPDETIDLFVDYSYIYIAKNGEIEKITIDSISHIDIPNTVTQIGDTILYRTRKYENGILWLNSYFRNQYGDSLFIGNPQAVDFNGYTDGLFYAKDTMYSLINKTDAITGSKSYFGYYQTSDIYGNLYDEIEIIEPDIEDLPSGNKNHYLYPQSIVDNPIDNTILLSYRYKKSKIEYAVLQKRKKNGDIIWRKDFRPNEGNSNSIYSWPNITKWSDDNIMMLWVFDIDKDSIPWNAPDSERLALGPSTIHNIDQDGTTNWSHTFFTYDRDLKYVAKIIEANNGDIIGVGQHRRGEDAHQINDRYYAWMFRMSSDGELLWEHYYIDEQYGGPTNFYDIVENPDGSFVIVGLIEDDNDNYHYNNNAYQWVLKVNADGCYYEGECEETVVIGTPKLKSHRNIWHVTTGWDALEPSVSTFRYGLYDNLHYQFVDSNSIYPRRVAVSEIQTSPTIDGEEWMYSQLFLKQLGEKVYLINGLLDKKFESLIYDFGLEVGDEFKSPFMWDTSIVLVVTAVEEMLLEDNKPRRKLTLRCKDDIDGYEYGYRTWIQGIGDTRGLLAHLEYSCSEEQGGTLLCYESYGKKIWINPEYNDCWLMTGVKKIDTDDSDGLILYPNPATNFITIEFVHPMSDISWEIVDIQGRVIRTKQELGSQDRLDIDLSILQSQIYNISIWDNRGELIGYRKISIVK